MKKIFSFLLLGLLLSVGNVWAADETITFASLSLTNGVQYSDPFEGDDFTVTFAGGGNDGKYYDTGSAIRVYGGGTMTIASTTKTIEEIVITYAAESYKPTSNNVVSVGSYNASTGTWTGSASSIVFTRPSGSGHWRVQSVAVTYETGGSQIEKVAAPTFSPAAGTFTSAQSVELSCETEDATIYYTLDGTDPTEAVSPLEYTGAIAISETTTIKAYAVKEDMADSQVATATYTIVTIEHAGTEEDPYTVADARNAIDLYGELSNKYVSGIISQVDSYNNTYGSITYWISDDGTTNNQLQAYSGLGLNQQAFSAATDLQVNDVVTVCGALKLYNSIYEFNYNNYLVAFSRPVDTTPSVEVASNAINIDAAGGNGTINVTYNNFDVDASVVYYCDQTGDAEVEYDWIRAEADENHNITYTVDPNTGDARTAYIRIYAVNDDSDELYSGVITITQAEYVVPVAPADFMYAKITATEQITDGQYLIVYEGNDSHDAVAFDGSLETLDAANNGVAVAINEGVIEGSDELAASEFTIDVTNGKLLSASGLYIGVTSQSNGLKQDEDVDKYTNSFEIDNEGNAIITAVFEGSTMTMKYNYASGNLRFRYYKSGQQDIALYKRCNLVLGTNGYSTYADDAAFTVSGATAYKAHYDAQQGAVVLTEVSGVIPAEQGIILKGEEGAPVTITPSAEEPTADFSDNNLVAVVEATTAPTNAHVLATIDDDNVTKFHPCAGIEIPAHKAYIVISGNNAPVRVIFAENNATAINNLEGDETAVKFIENGKLYIRKNGVVYDATGAVVR